LKETDNDNDGVAFVKPIRSRDTGDGTDGIVQIDF